MLSSSSRPIRPEISLCHSSGSSDGSPKISSSFGYLLDSHHYLQCVASGACKSTNRSGNNLPPMPDNAILNQRFNNVLASIDLPADKERMLKSYTDGQKWDIICALEKQIPRDTPSHYLSALNKCLDSKSVRFRKMRWRNPKSSITDILNHLEVSLRTNTMEWVEEFLGEANQGLETLVKYLKTSVEMLRKEHSEDNALRDGPKSTRDISTDISGPSSTLSMQSNHGRIRLLLARIFKTSRRELQTLMTDVHICLLCLRAIMNSQLGFNLVAQHHEAINLMVLSLTHKFVGTRTMILNLLAAICMAKGSHELVVTAFDNFQEVCREKRRFQTLLQFFMKNETIHMDFMVSCMKFLNVFVHSVEDFSYRAHLQYEFTALGLDVFLDKLSHTESEELKAEIDAYKSKFVDVSADRKTAELYAAANERIRELEQSIAREVECSNKFKHESERWRHEAEIAKRAAPKSGLALKIPHYVNGLPNGDGLSPLDFKHSNHTEERREKPPKPLTAPKPSRVGNIPMAPSPGIVPIPPPMPKSNNIPMPPPMPSAHNTPAPTKANTSLAPTAGAPDVAIAIKRTVQTQHKLPTLNWKALRPNQVRGTIFYEFDDERIYQQIDFTEFEERFKIGSLAPNDKAEIFDQHPLKHIPKEGPITLLETTRQRNVAISRCKLGKNTSELIAALNDLDLERLPLDNIELLLRMVPTEDEVKEYNDYIAKRKDVAHLSKEDQFMLQLTKVERLSTKLAIMNYMGNFHDLLHLLNPLIQTVTAAATSLKRSEKFKDIMGIFLAFGNYMNSSKHGPAYGFRLNSLDAFLDTKSNDKRTCLLHFIVTTIRQKYPHLLDFDVELKDIEKAAHLRLDNVATDVQAADKGMRLIKEEIQVDSHAHALRQFLSTSEDKLLQMKSDLKTAQDAFGSCLVYFGESSGSTDTAAFFTLVARFVRCFKTCDQENELRRRQELAAASGETKKFSKESLRRTL